MSAASFLLMVVIKTNRHNCHLHGLGTILCHLLTDYGTAATILMILGLIDSSIRGVC